MYMYIKQAKKKEDKKFKKKITSNSFSQVICLKDYCTKTTPNREKNVLEYKYEYVHSSKKNKNNAT